MHSCVRAAACIWLVWTELAGLGHDRQVVSSETLSGDMKLILEEITRALNLEKLLPCYRFTVTVSCVRALRQLQRFAHLPSDATIFRQYAQYGVFRDVRLASLDCLIDFIRSELVCTYCAHIHKHSHTHTYTHADHAHTHMLACMHTHTHTCTHTHNHAHTHVYIHRHTNTHTHLCMHALNHTLSHTYTHTYTDTNSSMESCWKANSCYMLLEFDRRRLHTQRGILLWYMNLGMMISLVVFQGNTACL